MRNRWLYIILSTVLVCSLLTGCGFSFGYELPLSKKEAKEEVLEDTEPFVETQEETKVERTYEDADTNKDGVVSLDEENEYKTKQETSSTDESNMEDDLLKALDELTSGLDSTTSTSTELDDLNYDGKTYSALGLNFILYEDYNLNVSGDDALLYDDSEETVIMLSRVINSNMKNASDEQKKEFLMTSSKNQIINIETKSVNGITFYLGDMAEAKEVFGEDINYSIKVLFMFNDSTLYGFFIGTSDKYTTDLLIDDIMYSVYFDGTKKADEINSENSLINEPEYVEETKVGQENSLSNTWKKANKATDIYSTNDYRTLTPKYVKINGLKLCLGDTWEQFANESTTYTYYLGDKVHSASVYLEKFDGTDTKLVSDYLDAYEAQVKKVFGEPVRVSEIVNSQTNVKWIEYVYSNINLNGITVDASIYLGNINDGLVYLEFVGKDTPVRYSDISLVLNSITKDAVE